MSAALRPLDGSQALRHVGRNVVLSVSGGRATVADDRLILTCGYGWRVVVTLGPDDLYRVAREFSRGGRIYDHGLVEGVYAENLSETVYRAGMFRDAWPGA